MIFLSLSALAFVGYIPSSGTRFLTAPFSPGSDSKRSANSPCCAQQLAVVEWGHVVKPYKYP